MAFITNTRQGLTFLTSSLLTDPGLRHGFSTRTGGVSPAPWDSLNLGVSVGDDMARVQENFRRFCGAVGVDERKVVLSRQVHEDNIRLVTAADCGKGLWRERDYESVDAMITQEPGLSLVVFSADCNVILLWDPQHHAAGAVHAGWRGVAAALVRKTAFRMQEAFGTDPAALRCAIGPAIGPCCFETDDDVPAALRKTLGDKADPYMTRQGAKWHIDLRAVNARLLRDLGVPADHIDVCSHCTACMPELYWSHRKLGMARGSQIALISLT